MMIDHISYQQSMYVRKKKKSKQEKEIIEYSNFHADDYDDEEEEDMRNPTPYEISRYQVKSSPIPSRTIDNILHHPDR